MKVVSVKIVGFSDGKTKPPYQAWKEWQGKEA